MEELDTEIKVGELIDTIEYSLFMGRKFSRHYAMLSISIGKGGIGYGYKNDRLIFEGTEKRKQYDTGAVGRTDWRYQ